MNTRDRIIYESLKLFSTNGFEAVSTRMIARAVEVSDTALYKHFKSKQEIFDTIIVLCKERMMRKQEEAKFSITAWEDVEQACMEMFRFQTEDEWIVMYRQLLILEQFKNPEMASIYQAFFIQGPLNSMTGLFTELMKGGHMKRQNPRVLAMELYAPFFMYHLISSKEESVLEELREHVTYFCRNNKEK